MPVMLLKYFPVKGFKRLVPAFFAKNNCTICLFLHTFLNICFENSLLSGLYLHCAYIYAEL